MYEYRLPKNLYIMEDSNAWTFWTCQDSDNVVVFKRDQATGCDRQLQNMSTCDMQSGMCAKATRQCLPGVLEATGAKVTLTAARPSHFLG